jgi:hypothetical protein
MPRWFSSSAAAPSASAPERSAAASGERTCRHFVDERQLLQRSQLRRHGCAACCSRPLRREAAQDGRLALLGRHVTERVFAGTAKSANALPKPARRARGACVAYSRRSVRVRAERCLAIRCAVIRVGQRSLRSSSDACCSPAHPQLLRSVAHTFAHARVRHRRRDGEAPQASPPRRCVTQRGRRCSLPPRAPGR